VKIVVATRNPGKVREFGEILAAFPDLELVGLSEAGLQESAEEDAVEAFETFEANALAKARYYVARLGMPVLADDSGLCVDALGGAPGVRSRRFSPGLTERGDAQDRANNDYLLELLRGVPGGDRGAAYRCAVAYADASGEAFVVMGECRGRILDAPRGGGGFGYDPLFMPEGEECSFGELSPEQKHRISHRGRALRAAAERISAATGAPAR
jgi:XTP/dITP diphosphohydrolase